LADAQGDPVTATRLGDQALALLEQVDETHDVRYSELLGRLADYYKATGNTHKGFEYVERALAAAESNGLGDTDASMTAMHNVASSLMGFGEVKEACAREKDVISRLQATGRTIITAMAVLQGICFSRADDAAQALDWYDKGLGAAQTGGDLSLEMHARAHRATALIALGRYAEAGRELDRVDELARQDVPMGGQPAARAQITRADLLLAQGRPDDAQRALEGVLPLLRDPAGVSRAFLPRALLCAARIAMAQKRYSESVDWANQALQEDLKRARDPAISADVGEASLVLAQAKDALHDQGGRRAAAHQALRSLTASLGLDNALTQEASALLAN
jgi:tetratricopeptide (TPR) repeat protein